MSTNMRRAMKKKLLFFCLLALLSVPNTSWAQQGKFTCGFRPYIILYSKPDCTGDYWENDLALDEKDLGVVKFDDKTHSVCGIGIWILYENKNFHQEMGAGMEIISSLCDQEATCRNLTVIPGKVSSIKAGNHPLDWRYTSLRIFPGPDFTGLLVLILNPPILEIDEIPSELKARRSIIMTGNSSFSIYNETFFKGDAICIKADNSMYQPYLLKDTHNVLPNYYWGKSARVGCEGKIVTLKGKKEGGVYIVE